MNKSQHTIIIESIEKIDSLLEQHEALFPNVPPVSWFGDMSSEKPKVVVISANPNKPDKPDNNPRIPYSTEWKKGGRDSTQLEHDYNNYFFHNPFTNWFGLNPSNESLYSHSQGRIEDFLNGLDASFYGCKTYQAIHIDLLPFSTKQSFVNVDSQLMAIEGLPKWIDDHIKEMIELIQPELIIINGISNFNFFNQCVNLYAQPYTAHLCNISEGNKHLEVTIWEAHKSDHFPPIIATSTNMGSYCLYTPETLNTLGCYVKELKIF